MYSLRLSDDQSWGIETAEGTQGWADEFARLLGLERSEGFPDQTMRLERLPAVDDAEHGFPGAPQHGYPGENWQVRILRSLEFWRHPAVRQVVCKLHQTTDQRRVKQQMKHVLFPVYDSTVCRGGIPLHSALVDLDGRGVQFVGISGVGKSTACRRLPPRWIVLGDDLALAVRRPGGGFAVHPLPTRSAVGPDSEKRAWDIQRGVRLSSIFFLTQAAEDEVLPTGRAKASVILADAAMTIFHSVQARPNPVEKSLLFRGVFDNAATMANSVPSYVLRLSLEGRFWEKIEKVLEKEKGDSRPFAVRDERIENGMTGTREKNDNAVFCRGESMRPMFRPGDRIHFVPCRVEELQRGDVIVFTPRGQKERVVHRVVSTGLGGIRTQGDANPCGDTGELQQENIIGRVLSMERKGKMIHVAGGLAGRLLAGLIRAFRTSDHLASHVLSPCYGGLARSGLFRALLPSALRPRVNEFDRDGSREMHLVLGRRIIGRRPAGAGAWTIRRPFRIFVDERTLP